MHNRVITLALFGLVLLMFTCYFAVLKNTFPAGQPVAGLLAGISEDARLEQWPAAVAKARLIEKQWQRWKHLIMLNFAEADCQTFESIVYRLTAATEGKNKEETINCARTGQKLWANFLKIIPEP